MNADDLAIHYQRIARGIAQQLHRDGVVRNAPCVWGAVTDALIAADKTGFERATEGSRAPLSDADAERLADIKACPLRLGLDREWTQEFLLRLLDEARGGNAMMEPDRDERERTAGWRP